MDNNVKLKLVSKGDFLGVKCDFYKDQNNNVYMTREQVGKALQYNDPIRNISKLHERNKERLDKFSVVVKLTTTDKKQYNTTLYTEKGIYDICRFSKQPVADQFYDWVYDKIETIRLSAGTIELGREKEFLDNYFPTLTEETKKMMVYDLQNTIKEQQQKIKEMKPHVDDWEAFMDAKGNITMAKLAKALNIKGLGRNNLFALLRKKGILRYNNEPYQQYAGEDGYFKIICKTYSTIIDEKTYTQTLVTPKGMSFINKKLKEWGYC